MITIYSINSMNPPPYLLIPLVKKSYDIYFILEICL
jgi:hypothetical protein